MSGICRGTRRIWRESRRSGAIAVTFLLVCRGENAMIFNRPGHRDGIVMLTNGASGFDVMIEVGTRAMAGTPFAVFLASGRKK